MGRWYLFSHYNEKSNIINLLSWLLISIILENDDCPIMLQEIWSNATLPLDFVFMNKESKIGNFLYVQMPILRPPHEITL